MKPEVRAFLSPNRAEALEQFPQLKESFATRDALEFTARSFKPGNDAVLDAVKREIRTLGAQQLENRGTFQESDAFHKSVQFHTAYNRLERGPEGSVPQEHRKIIAEYADKVATQSPRGSNGWLEATTLAGALGSRAESSEPSPFRSEKLTAVYDRQKQYMAYLETRTQASEPTWGDKPLSNGVGR